jgi:signal transduction histidine kinase
MRIKERRPTVLVVDDRPANLIAMRAVLSPLAVDVVEASSGEEALEAVATSTFAVALIDVQMPGMDGFQLAARLRQTPNGKELPIVFVSAVHRDERYVQEGYAAGAADYLTKPLDVDVLRARVHAFIDLFRQQERLREIEVGDRTRERDEALDQLASLLNRERAARHDAEMANAAKDEFIAIASHELRTPLTSILGWAVLARTLPPGSPELDQALQTIERNARAQKLLIDDLLEMSRAMGGKLQIRVGDVSLDETLAAAVDSLRPVADERHITLDVADTRAGVIQADPDRLREVISNLLSNALKFTPREGHVWVSARRTGNRAEIRIRDDGEGIPEEFLPHVFEPFKQADASVTRRHGGLGLGLAIVKQLVEAHGGTIRAASAGKGRGATFTIELPTKPSQVVTAAG